MLQVRVETDPSDRTQMRLTVASEDANTTYEYVHLTEFNIFCICFLTVPQIQPSEVCSFWCSFHEFYIFGYCCGSMHKVRQQTSKWQMHHHEFFPLYGRWTFF